jgi:hypothetical protein
MTQPLPDPVFVILSDEEPAGRIVVDLDAFLRFTAQLDASLAELEAKWAHWLPARNMNDGRSIAG